MNNYLKKEVVAYVKATGVVLLIVCSLLIFFWLLFLYPAETGSFLSIFGILLILTVGIKSVKEEFFDD